MYQAESNRRGRCDLAKIQGEWRDSYTSPRAHTCVIQRIAQRHSSHSSSLGNTADHATVETRLACASCKTSNSFNVHKTRPAVATYLSARASGHWYDPPIPGARSVQVQASSPAGAGDRTLMSVAMTTYLLPFTAHPQSPPRVDRGLVLHLPCSVYHVPRFSRARRASRCPSPGPARCPDPAICPCVVEAIRGRRSSRKQRDLDLSMRR